MAVVLVTGANGFIGSHLVEELLESPHHHVMALVRPSSDVSSLAPLQERHGERLRLVFGDVREPEKFAWALKKAEYIYHLAGVIWGTREQDYWDTNADGTRKLVTHLLDPAHRHPEFQRFLLTSSQAAAGGSDGPTPIDETATPRPPSWYGKSKLEAERVVLDPGVTKVLPVSVVRPTVVYGERDMDLSRALFPFVSRHIRPRIGIGTKWLTPVYVGDVAKGMIAVAEGGVRTLGRTYFLAEKPCRDLDLTDAAARGVGRKLIPIPLPDAWWGLPIWILRLLAPGAEWYFMFTRHRPLLNRNKVNEVALRYSCATADAARRDVGWTAQVDLNEGMKRAAADWRQRRRAGRQLARLPGPDRTIMTYVLGVLLGLVVESEAGGRLYAYDHWWLLPVIVVAGFGGVMGTIAYAMAGRSLKQQWQAGALLGIVAEAANALWLHPARFGWDFCPIVTRPVLRLTIRLGMSASLLPVVLVLVFGLLAGLVPVVITTMLRSLSARRARIG